MSVNPFESPSEVAVSAGEDDRSSPLAGARLSAARRYQVTILILAAPAIANLLLFNYFITGVVQPQGLFYLLATLNVIGVALVIAGALLGGFYVLELLTRLANRLFGSKPQLGLWYEELYAVVRQACLLAIPATLLWAGWLWLFYGTTYGTVLLSIPFLVIAHLMAASLYVGLIWRWYKIPKQV